MIAPLDWGLGHATRCVPLIRHIIDSGNAPIIAAAGRPLQLLRAEFPNAEFLAFEGYNISYPEGSGMAWKMFRSTPGILKRIKNEHVELQEIIRNKNIDAVISDNRFGLYTNRVPCVYMTHQVMIKAPLFETMLYRMHMNYMRRFSRVWVPDYGTHGLSGDLAHKYPMPFNGKFIGPLSRFSKDADEIKREVLIVISGPEPQRTRFEKMVLDQMEKYSGTAMAVLGTPEKEVSRPDKLGHQIVSHLSANEMQKAMSQSKLVVSRSGYSTIMDLSILGKKAVFIPTPGQTEQEYLAEKYHKEKRHLKMKQRDFNLQLAIERSTEYTGFDNRSSSAYKEAVDELLATIS